METLVTGVVRTAFGVKGYMKIKLYSEDYRHIEGRAELTLQSGTRKKVFLLEDLMVKGPDVMVKLKGIDSPEMAKQYNGWEIVVPRDEAAPLDTGEFYQVDLCGCALLYDGKEVGTVLSVLDGAQSDLLEVKTESGIKLIPFMSQYIGAVDIKSKTVVLLEEWLLT